MSTNLGRWLSRLALSFGATAWLTSAVAAQVVPPTPAAEAAKQATDSAKEATKEATGDAKEAAKQGTEAAKEATKDATDKAKEATKDATDAAKEATKDATDTAKDATKDATDTAREAAKGAADTARDAARGARDTAREGAKDVREGARDIREGVREGARDARDAAGNAAKDARDATRDAVRDARDTARDVGEAARDTARDVREGVREARDEFRGARNEFRADRIRSADIGIWFDRSARDSLVISDIGTTGAIAKVGFHEGDRIISVNGHKVTREADFNRYLFADDVRNERVKVVVYRGNAEQVVYVEPAVLVEQYTTVSHDPLETFGVVLDDRYDNRIVVWKVLPRSPAFYAGIRTGDIITTFHGQRVSTSKDFIALVSKTDPGEINVEVSRGDKTRTFAVDVPRMNANVRTALRPSVEAGVDRRTERRDDRAENRDTRQDLRNGDTGERRDVRKEAGDQRREERREAVETPATPATPDNGTYENNGRRGIFRRR